MTAPQNQQPKLTLQRQKQTVQFFLERLTDDISIEMMQIPAGAFLMGSPEGEFDRSPGLFDSHPGNFDESPEGELDRSPSEGPQHGVRVAAFFMSKYPVTQAQWRFVAELPQVNRELKPAPSRFKGDKRPVEQVSWYDAVEFCARLSTYTSRPYRLPTEAEWEYACRASPVFLSGLSQPGDAAGSGDSTPFHFGETITTDLANYRGTDNKELNWSGSYGRGPKGEYREETTPVDYFGIANAFGLCDMHGNVWEWCQDHWHSNYEGAPIDGSAWLSEDENAERVLRGGSWFRIPSTCRSAFRYYFPPVYTADLIGFRVVCSAPRT
ncbi:formylglycine-generating enzyme family protein [Leptolyngbya sp. FACHB-671]|uniref:formylglycine-generating enzyme family protein n=1 Tax=Leptolyngbya sp. FACHB-671 TaxID=2692812 RepID=UPI001686B2BC|nr:formylglycine-generating enzyme family protein [Leptolyngbya sp. FACHB-671]MBD2066239.1 formylglycine-generating enzyme family protein [Leptolyngbya sp. FACHB-671]